MAIDEKVLIDRLEEQKSDWNYDYNVPINDAIKIVNQLAEEHNNGWIPCSERMPIHLQDVLITDNKGNVSIASFFETQETHDIYWEGEGFYEYRKFHGWCKIITIAWQPLFAPYKGEQK